MSKPMSESEMRMAIAEKCGFGTKPVTKPTPLPDYLKDLNAMHIAVTECLGINDLKLYTDHLRIIVQRDNRNSLDAIEELAFMVDATARQRAEAFLAVTSLESAMSKR